MYGCKASVLVLAFLASCGSILAQEDMPAPVGDLVERYSPAAQISGTPVMGLALSGPLDPNAGQITAFVPAKWQDQVFCARAISSDGRYLAQREYKVPAGWTSRLVPLSFPTRSGSQLPHKGNDDIGVTTWLGSCESDPAELRIAPAIWNGESAIAEGGMLLVNSFRSQETYLIVGDPGERVACANLAHERRTAFDTACNLPPSLMAPGQTLEVELNRIRRGQIVPGVTFTIDLQ